MTDYENPPVWLRLLGIAGAGFIAVYGTIGVLRNDLSVSLSKTSRGVHLHGLLAWFCFAGMLMMSIGMFRLLAPTLGDKEFDMAVRRARFGPLIVVGLAFYVVAQLMAGRPS